MDQARSSIWKPITLPHRVLCSYSHLCCSCFPRQLLPSAGALLSKLTSGRCSAYAQHNWSMRGLAGHKPVCRNYNFASSCVHFDVLTSCQSARNHLQAHPLPKACTGQWRIQDSHQVQARSVRFGNDVTS